MNLEYARETLRLRKSVESAISVQVLERTMNENAREIRRSFRVISQ